MLFFFLMKKQEVAQKLYFIFKKSPHTGLLACSEGISLPAPPAGYMPWLLTPANQDPANSGHFPTCYYHLPRRKDLSSRCGEKLSCPTPRDCPCVPRWPWSPVERPLDTLPLSCARPTAHGQLLSEHHCAWEALVSPQMP